MSTDKNNKDSELDNIIDKLGLEELENDTVFSEEGEEGESLIDLNIVNDEINNSKFKSPKKWKKLNISIIAGGALIVILLVTILIIKGCSSAAVTGDDTTNISGFYDGQGTTAGNIDRPENVTSANITDSDDETETPLDPSIR